MDEPHRLQPFGPTPWGPAVSYGAPMVATPVGEPCLYCAEPVSARDYGFLVPCLEAKAVGDPLIFRIRPQHFECHIRMTIGSVGHQLEMCSCHGGTDEDPPGMSKRDAALAATDLFLCARPHLRGKPKGDA